MGNQRHNRGGPGRTGSPRRAQRRRAAKRRALQAASAHAQDHRRQAPAIPVEPAGPVVSTGAGRLQRARRWIVGSSLVAIALLTVASVFAYLLIRSAPAWWRTVDPQSPASAQAGELLQNALGNQFTAVRPAAADLKPGERWRSEVWRFAVEVDDANAWLNTSLPNWIKSDPDMPAWPDDIGSIQVAFRSGLMYVGIELLRGDGVPQYLAAAVRPEMREDGSLWIPADTVLVGRLPIPPEVVLSQARARVHNILPEDLTERGRALLRVFEGDEPLAESPVIRLGDGRQVRVLDIQPRDHRLIVSCQTEQSEEPRATNEPRP